MLRRAAVLLLTTVLASAGLTVGACPQARCAMRQAKAMTCCQHGGLTRPSCCPPVERIGQRATPPATDRPADAVAHAAWLPLSLVLAAPARALPGAALRIEPGTAPPGTLIAQHTALLL
jgi:hypothetical protein